MPAAGARAWSATCRSGCRCCAATGWCSTGRRRGPKNCGAAHEPSGQAQIQAGQARAQARGIRRSSGRTRKRTGVQTVKRDARRRRHAARPVLRGAVSRAVVLPHPAHHPQGRGARRRQARAAQGPAAGRPGGAHSAAQARRAQARTRTPPRRRRTAPSSSRSRSTKTTTCWCSTSRWGSPCRAAPAPRGISTACWTRCATRRASARGWCTGSTRTPPAACWWRRRALPRPRSPRPSARARRARSTGRWSPACRSRGRAASPRSSPRRSARTIRSCASRSHGEEGASHAVTYYAVVETAARTLAWLSLKPVTGRTHQLRAHMAHIGHPIVGDPKYFSIENWELPGGIQNRLHLLARRIVVPHPRGGTIDVTAPLPPHMQQSWNLLGLRRRPLRPDRGGAGGVGNPHAPWLVLRMKEPPMSLTQLNPPLPLETSKGPGWAHFVIDYGQESALLWVCSWMRTAPAGRSRTMRSAWSSTGPSAAASPNGRSGRCPPWRRPPPIRRRAAPGRGKVALMRELAFC